MHHSLLHVATLIIQVAGYQACSYVVDILTSKISSRSPGAPPTKWDEQMEKVRKPAFPFAYNIWKKDGGAFTNDPRRMAGFNEPAFASVLAV